MLIKSRKSWEMPESAATPESLYLNRRSLLAGLAGIGAALGATRPANALFGFGEAEPAPLTVEGDPTVDLYPAPLNSSYADAGRAVTAEDVTARYNNFYEFGSHKEIWPAAQALETRPWTVTFDGLVEEERTVDIDTLIRAMRLEERVYRHRCVEAWSMVVPWTGFPMKALVDYARPLGSARYVRMETFNNPDVATGQRASWYPWPYVEGLRLDEATHELAFMVTGVYGRPAAKQFGAPLRLALPWKYGFKSIKSIVRFTFTEERPASFWETINASEYGFWANVNPAFPHPRWSQASERVLGGHDRVPTQIFNGYGAEIGSLYDGMDAMKLFM